MFESRISAGVTENNYRMGKPHAKNSRVEGHARKCVERYCELANKQVGAALQSFKSLLG